MFISGENNFRYRLYPEYKANRRDKPRPRHLEAVRENLVREWNAEITDGYEADDALGISSQTGGGIVCSIDKDLLQLPGQHYHFVDRRFEEISDSDGWRNFYTQVLTGDSGDNIHGCPGIGRVRSYRMLYAVTDVSEMFRITCAAYAKAGRPIQDLILAANLLYVLRKEDDQWTPPLPVKHVEAKNIISSKMENTSNGNANPVKSNETQIETGVEHVNATK